MQTGALIAAAGGFSAMKEHRPLLMMNGTSLIQKEIDILRQADISPIVVVTGDGAEQLERHLSHRGVVCLRNEDYENTQMLDSVKIGLQYLRYRCQRVLFLPVHAPLFSVESVQRVLEQDAPVVKPTCEGKSGHPILIGSELFDFILNYNGEGGLQGALTAWPGKTALVEVEDAGVLLKIGNEQDYQKALAYENESRGRYRIHQTVRVTLERDTPFFGPGIACLLEQVDKEGSLLAACKSMKMSYSKGWKMIKALEEAVGYPFLIRRTGGADGGNSLLTEEGQHFLLKYRAMEKEINAAAEKSFARYFLQEGAEENG